MASAGSDWRIAILRPGNDPVGNLARAVAAPGCWVCGRRKGHRHAGCFGRDNTQAQQSWPCSSWLVVRELSSTRTGSRYFPNTKIYSSL